MNQPPPITLDQIPAEWIESVREIVRREGRAVRPNPIERSVEIKSLTDNSWGRLMLPTNALALVSDDAACVLVARILAP